MCSGRERAGGHNAVKFQLRLGHYAERVVLRCGELPERLEGPAETTVLGENLHGHARNPLRSMCGKPWGRSVAEFLVEHHF